MNQRSGVFNRLQIPGGNIGAFNHYGTGKTGFLVQTIQSTKKKAVSGWERHLKSSGGY